MSCMQCFKLKEYILELKCDLERAMLAIEDKDCDIYNYLLNKHGDIKSGKKVYSTDLPDRIIIGFH